MYNIGPSHAALAQPNTSIGEVLQDDTILDDNQFCYNIGPPSTTLAQHNTNIGSVCEDDNPTTTRR